MRIDTGEDPPPWMYSWRRPVDPTTTQSGTGPTKIFAEDGRGFPVGEAITPEEYLAAVFGDDLAKFVEDYSFARPIPNEMISTAGNAPKLSRF